MVISICVNGIVIVIVIQMLEVAFSFILFVCSVPVLSLIMFIL
jgi:hypothetical protein